MPSKALRTGPTGDIAVTGYLASGSAGNGSIWRVYCSSSWLRAGDGWTILHHQQTPA